MAQTLSEKRKTISPVGAIRTVGSKMGRDVRTNSISFQEFVKVEIRSGTIARAEEFPEARKAAYKLWIDFGPELGLKTASAQLTKHYTLEQLLGKQVVAVVNFTPKQVATFLSEVLVLGLPDEHGDVVLVQPERPVPNGVRLF